MYCFASCSWLSLQSPSDTEMQSIVINRSSWHLMICREARVHGCSLHLSGRGQGTKLRPPSRKQQL